MLLCATAYGALEMHELCNKEITGVVVVARTPVYSLSMHRTFVHDQGDEAPTALGRRSPTTTILHLGYLTGLVDTTRCHPVRRIRGFQSDRA